MLEPRMNKGEYEKLGSHSGGFQRVSDHTLWSWRVREAGKVSCWPNTYTYDNNRRLSELEVSHSSTSILDLGYTYDNNSNITQITDNNDNTKNKLYEYDNKNQLTKATIPTEAYLENTAATGDYYLKTADYIGAGVLGTQPSGLIKLDYMASSVAIDFGVTTPGIKKITLEPDSSYQTHRITGQTIDLYTSNNNSTYTLVLRNNWTFDKDSNGKATITLTNSVSARYLKLHVKFDDLDGDGEAVDTNSQFLNTLASMLRVYMETSTKEESYEYDEAGNRTLRTVKLVLTNDFHSYYYTNSDRLKKDGVYGYEYDAAGNLVKKGNTFTDSNDTLTFTTSGQGVEYWEFAYDLLNRLIEVQKNGTSGMDVVAEYGYSPDGLRQVKTAGGYTTHYVFEGTEPIFEKKMETEDHDTVSYTRSYVYAFGKHIARVDGVIGDTNADKYWYVTDHEGSVRFVTDDTGATVWSADYEAFGNQINKDVGTGFQEDEFAYTGKGLDGDTGLYYFNARWYDSTTGRFISEDPAADPNNPNLYSYCRNNPVNVTDPTGLSTVVDNNGKLIDHQDDGDDTTYRQDTDGTWYVTTTIHTPPPGRSQTYYDWWESTHRYSTAFWNKNGGIPNDMCSKPIMRQVTDPKTGETTWVFTNPSDILNDEWVSDENTDDYGLPTTGTVTSVYGDRNRPVWYDKDGKLHLGSAFHYGWDIANKQGTKVVSVEGGIVRYAQYMNSENGYVVAIQHNDGNISYYFHVQNISVTIGQEIPKGFQIAEIGNIGTGPYLHFAMGKNGELFDQNNYYNPINSVFVLADLPYTNEINVTNGNYSNKL